jgi:uncharacterized membrane protein (DUF2068 family)
MPTRRENDLGLRLLVLYKIAHGVIVLALGIAVAVATSTGADARFRDWAMSLREHVSRAWTIYLLDTLIRATSAHNFMLVAAVMMVDGLFTFFEGWALHRRFHWAPWLVIIATSALLPFELFEIVERPRVTRVVLLAVNILVVLYLVRRNKRAELVT